MVVSEAHSNGMPTLPVSLQVRMLRVDGACTGTLVAPVVVHVATPVKLQDASQLAVKLAKMLWVVGSYIRSLAVSRPVQSLWK